MDYARWLLTLLAYLGVSIPPSLAQSAPETGWWWNPNESGRGYFIDSQAGTTYLAGYFYSDSGHPTWLIAAGANTDPSLFRGRLLRYTEGQTLAGAYRPPAPAVDAGEVTLRFSDHRTGTLTWPGGTVPIQRMVFGPPADGFQPDTGLWWNEAESGSGYNLEVQGDTLFVNAFVYDEAGRAIWYLSAGKMSTPRRYEGPWLRFANGQTIDGTYRPPSSPVEAGRLAIEFLEDDEAEFTFTVPDATTSRPDAKVQRKVRAKRFWRLPRLYSGRFTYVLKQQVPPHLYDVEISLVYEGEWVRESAVAVSPQACPTTGVKCKTYVLIGNSLADVRFSGDIGVAKCSGNFRESGAGLNPSAPRIVVYPTAQYFIEFPSETPRVWTLLGSCKSNLPPYNEFPYPLVVAIESRHMVRDVGEAAEWSFFAKPGPRELSARPKETITYEFLFNAFQ